MKKSLILLSTVLFLSLSNISLGQDAMIAEVKLFAGNFAPRGWAFCEGQLLPISEYQALFSLLGTIYGGDGRTTFALPDLRGRVPVGVGTGPGLEPVTIGQKTSNGEVGTTGQARLGMHYIICLQGIFPSRS